MKYAIGVDLGGTRIKAGLVAESGEITLLRSVETLAQEKPEAVGSQIADLARKIHEESGVGADIVGIGLGSPGLIDGQTGVIHVSPNFPKWTDVPLSDYVKSSLSELRHLPVFVENDVNAMTLGEYCYGAGRGARTVIGMTLGTGVGGGIVVDGKLHSGVSNTAGEIGHMTVLPGGRRCGCGNDGCLEALVGRYGMIARVQEALRSGRASEHLAPLFTNPTSETLEDAPKLIQDAAKVHDPLAWEIYEDSGKYIGIVLAAVANLLNPDVAVIGGGTARAGEELLFRYIRAEVHRRAFSVPAKAMRIVPAELGNDAGLAGAATIALRAAN